MSESTSTEPNWNRLNFHQVMVLICDTYGMTHLQMMALRRKIQSVYDQQKPGKGAVAVKALAVLAFQRIGEEKDVLAMKPGKMVKLARKVEEELL